jgi:hypothetical protein
MANAAYGNDVPAMRDNAVKYRDTVTTWRDRVGKISFPLQHGRSSSKSAPQTSTA